MIYFLTDWHLEIENFEADILFNIIQTFNTYGEETAIVNMSPAPFMNYFTNQFDFKQSEHILGLFDYLIEKRAYISAPLGINDLILPKNYEKTYTNNQVLLSMDGIVKGEVYFNPYGFVSQVHYLLENGKEVDTYSERGFILSKEILNAFSEVKERQFFNELGQLIFTEYPIGVTISSDYLDVFHKKVYDSYKNVCIEMMNNILKQFNPKVDDIILDGTNLALMEIVRGFAYPENIIYVVSGKSQRIVEQISPFIDLFEKSQCIITDNTSVESQIKEVIPSAVINKKVQLLPSYSTVLNLGESNTYREQYIYWKIEHFSLDVKVRLLEFLREKIAAEELCLLIDSKIRTDAGHIQKTVEDFVCQTFEVQLDTSEYTLVQEYYEALEKEEMTQTLREQFTEAKSILPNFINFINAYLFIQGIEFRYHPEVQHFREDLRKTRIFVDQREEEEYFSHSLAVSAGIPLILAKPSPYLIEQKNGVILKESQEVVHAVMDYINNVDLWNKNLVESVEIIQNYSVEGLMLKWRDILR